MVVYILLMELWLVSQPTRRLVVLQYGLDDTLLDRRKELPPRRHPIPARLLKHLAVDFLYERLLRFQGMQCSLHVK